jgi:hypothetical protein
MTYRARPTNASVQPASATQTNTADPACTACPEVEIDDDEVDR